MYCKCKKACKDGMHVIVLIVAKCIVNSVIPLFQYKLLFVLIVAKCIVNADLEHVKFKFIYVLIVAKCIVNRQEG